ncbi:MAG: alginate export family protein, partial [Chitinophagaceae bacterium]|nr:alginate export family protein [Chitinophagaceae bacterium]
MLRRNGLLKRLYLPVCYGIILVTPTMQAFSQKPGSDSSDSHLTITAQFRPRFEIRNGAFRPLSKGERPAQLISERIRLTFDYDYKDILTARISPQTVGIWGQANLVQGVENDGNRIALFEAWAKLKLSKNWSLKLGRQVISLDDERFFGELDWAQGARAHDALSVQFNRYRWEVKAFAAFNQNYKSLYGNNINNPSGNLYNTSDAFPYKEMQTVWAGFQVSKN